MALGARLTGMDAPDDVAGDEAQPSVSALARQTTTAIALLEPFQHHAVVAAVDGSAPSCPSRPITSVGFRDACGFT